MNITPLQYAKALFSATEHVSEPEVQDIVARFADRLRRDGQTRNLPRIVGKFSELWNASHGIVEAEVVSRIPLGVAEKVTIERAIAQLYGAKEVIITNRVDELIRGGVVIRVGDELLDGSIATQLTRLRKQLRAH